MMENQSKFNILLADDHHLVRSGIRKLLENLSEVNVVAEASNGLEIFDVLTRHSIDIILMDVAMPKMNGIVATERISKEFPHIKVIILSIYSNDEYISQALNAGAKSYLLKSVRLNELEEAIHEVTQGRIYLCKDVSQKFYENSFNQLKIGNSPVNQLTTRQKEVLQLIVEGNSTKEIADILKLSVKTVDMHRHNLMEALDIHDVANLVRFAIDKKII